MDNPEERLPVVDEQGHVIGSISRAEAHGGSMTLHPVVHLHLFNSKGELYLQKRPDWKDIQPGRWDTATGGHVGIGESIVQALRREVEEELGITDFTSEALGHYVFGSDRERELVFVNKAVYDGPVSPNPEELAGGRFWSHADIMKNMGNGLFTPNFESEYQRFFVCRQQ